MTDVHPLGRFVLSEPDEPLDADGRRFALLADGRALDAVQRLSRRF